jgi:hypothetical protein
MLAEIVPKFSNLKRILFCDSLEEFDPMRRCDLKEFSWDDLSSVAKEIPLEPGRHPSTNQDIRFWNLLIAASLLPRSSQLLSLQASCLSPYRWIQQVRFIPSYKEAFALFPIWKIYLYNSPRRKEGHKEFKSSTSANSSPARRI